VGGLPPHYDDRQLRGLFAPYGEISSCNVIRDKETGVSRNFGFVNFLSPQDAQNAINSVNGVAAVKVLATFSECNLVVS